MRKSTPEVYETAAPENGLILTMVQSDDDIRLKR